MINHCLFFSTSEILRARGVRLLLFIFIHFHAQDDERRTRGTPIHKSARRIWESVFLTGVVPEAKPTIPVETERTQEIIKRIQFSERYLKTNTVVTGSIPITVALSPH